jgi:hypothetical protein
MECWVKRDPKFLTQYSIIPLFQHGCSVWFLKFGYWNVGFVWDLEIGCWNFLIKEGGALW